MRLLRYNRFALLASCCGWLLLGSCDVIFEDDIDGQTITLLAPADETSTTIQTINFDWMDLDDAVAYRIQVGEPNFVGLEALVLDSLVTQSELEIVLNPGNYEWRVRGENSGSETEYAVRSLTIVAAEGLEGQTVLLNSPTADLVTSDSLVTFTWTELAAAESYTVEILDDNEGQPGDLVMADIAIAETSVETELDEGAFWWRVIASNSVPSVSDYSEARQIEIDLTDPVPSILQEPLDNSFIGSPSQVFTWTEGSDANLSDYQLIIYSDQGLETVVLSQSSTELSLDQDLTSLASGVYYWQVRTNDAAGNFSLSDARSFTK
ncbi:hypothetical protein [Sanyastnella coralliicola]|uniref:hypothetical protein n=1 Tax=Sanyastnella coralliicola TaxID=3069118 RepID=UPI0027BAE096|nr:hypothetical protein [Longitalea sp. SCSIO 12813]